MNTATLFADLPAATAGADFSAARLFGTEHRIAKDKDGRATLMLWIGETAYAMTSTSYTLEHVTVAKNIDCTVRDPDGLTSSARFSLMQCMSSDPELQRSFFSVCDAIVQQLAGGRTSSTNQALDRLIQLFTQLLRPSRAAAAGVWAELFVISESRDPASLIAGWHRDADELFDFTRGDTKVDVKASTQLVRAHHFSLEQVRASAGDRVIIVSVLLKAATGGTSIANLIDRIRGCLAGEADLLIHFEETVAGLMGSSWRAFQREAFDMQYARANVACFDASSIPAVATPLPIEVSAVRFRVDLTNVLPLMAGSWPIS